MLAMPWWGRWAFGHGCAPRPRAQQHCCSPSPVASRTTRQTEPEPGPDLPPDAGGSCQGVILREHFTQP